MVGPLSVELCDLVGVRVGFVGRYGGVGRRVPLAGRGRVGRAPPARPGAVGTLRGPVVRPADASWIPVADSRFLILGYWPRGRTEGRARGPTGSRPGRRATDVIKQ